MSTITSLNTSDSGATSRTTINTNFTNLNTDKIEAATTVTLTNKTLTAPKFADLGFIADANGNELLIFDSSAGATEQFTITNSNGSDPALNSTLGIELNATNGGGIFVTASNSSSSTGGSTAVQAGHSSGGNGDGGTAEMGAGNGNGSGAGGTLDLFAGAGGATGSGGPVSIAAGNGNGVGNGGSITMMHGGGGVSGKDGAIKFSSPNAGSVSQFGLGQALTSNNTQTTAYTFTMAADSMVTIEAYVSARRYSGAAGADGDCAGYKFIGTYKKVGAGGATIVGTVTALHTAESQAGWDATFTTSGNTVLLSVTGATNNNVIWNWQVNYIIATT